MPKKKSVKKYPTIYVGYSEEITTEVDDDYCAEHIDWTLVGCFKHAKNSAQLSTPIEVDFDCDVGDSVYVVYVRYCSGHTFGAAYGAVDVVKVFKTKHEAEKLKAAIDTTKSYSGGPYGYYVWESSTCSFHGCYIEKCIVQ